MSNQTSKQKKRINKQWRSWPNVSTWSLTIFGLPPLICGLALIALGSGWLPVKLKEPAGFIVFSGFVFLICGLWVFVLGLRPILHQRRPASSLTFYLQDYPWSPGGIDGDFESPLARTALNALILASFLIPINLIAWSILQGDSGGKILLYLFLGIFDFMLLAYLIQLLGYAWQRLRFGKAHLSFERFPYYPGDMLAVTFRNPRALSDVPLMMTLRCIEEKVGYSSQYDLEGQIVCEQIFAEQKEARTDVSGGADLSFSIPLDAPGTKLKAKMPVYWELLVESLTPGIKFKRVFLIPVYKASLG